MMLNATLIVLRLRTLPRKFARDRRGVVAVTFALSAMAVILAVGAGLDLERAYVARQQLSAVATLTCQYANRPIIVSKWFGSCQGCYAASVNAYGAVALAAQQASWTQTVATPFTYTAGRAGTVALAASVPATILHIIGIANMPVSVSAQCFAVLASAPQQPAPDGTAPLLVDEGFENSAYPTSIAWYTPSGTVEPYSSGQVSNPALNTPPANAGYVGANGNEWIITGYCLEVDAVGKTVSTVPEGTHSAELDCDNGSKAVLPPPF